MTGAAWLGGISPSRKTSSSAALGWRSPRSPPLAIRPLPKKKDVPQLSHSFPPPWQCSPLPRPRAWGERSRQAVHSAVGIDHATPAQRRGLLRIDGAARAHGYPDRGALLVRTAKVG